MINSWVYAQHRTIMLSSKLKLNAFPRPAATHTEVKTSLLVDVAVSVFHLPLKEGNVPRSINFSIDHF